mgnify:CR=1 FL=1
MMNLTKKELECVGFGFGAAVVLGVAAWGAFELGRKVVREAKRNHWFERIGGCCCGQEDEEDDLVDKAVNAMDEVVASEFDRNGADEEA